MKQTITISSEFKRAYDCATKFELEMQISYLEHLVFMLSLDSEPTNSIKIIISSIKEKIEHIKIRSGV